MKVLIIEDDKILSDTIYQCLKNKFKIDTAYNGEDGLYLAIQNIYDVIILDLMMPILDGIGVITELRKQKNLTPILILTAKDTLKDKVFGLKIGADDYLTKPFEIEELIARIEAIIRRNTGEYIENIVCFKDLKLDLNIRQAKINNNILNLQGKLFDMLEYLIINKNRIITKNQIFDKIWGFNSYTTTNVVEVYASGIRKELKKYNYDKYLNTVRGIGYMICGDIND
ncbi:MAG: response regulator transcription factor [Clostridia bacterium]